MAVEACPIKRHLPSMSSKKGLGAQFFGFWICWVSVVDLFRLLRVGL